MINLTLIKFQVEAEIGIKYGAFAFDRSTSNSINIEKIFERLQKQQADGVKIKFDTLPEKTKDQCEKEGITQLDSAKKVEELIIESITFLKKLDSLDE